MQCVGMMQTCKQCLCMWGMESPILRENTYLLLFRKVPIGSFHYIYKEKGTYPSIKVSTLKITKHCLHVCLPLIIADKMTSPGLGPRSRAGKFCDCYSFLLRLRLVTERRRDGGWRPWPVLIKPRNGPHHHHHITSHHHSAPSPGHITAQLAPPWDIIILSRGR